MQSFEHRTVGIDTAVLDIKVKADKDFHFAELTDTNNIEGAIYCAGGVTGNILTAHSMVTNNPVRLYACIGTDKNGFRYEVQTPKALGLLQRANTSTGIVGVVLMDDGTSRFDYIDLGAGMEVTLTENEYSEPSSLVYVDLIQARTPSSSKYIEELLHTNTSRGGIWSLNIAGANRYPNMDSVFNSFRYPPDILFGNQYEYASLCGVSSSAELTKDILQQSFSAARLIVMTRGKEGADIIFEGIDAHISAEELALNVIIDETGAGDCFHGTMVGILSNKPYKNWTINDVLAAGEVASKRAADVIQTYQNRILQNTSVNNFPQDS